MDKDIGKRLDGRYEIRELPCEAEARKRVIYRVTFVGFVVNLVLTAMKLGKEKYKTVSGSYESTGNSPGSL